MQASRLHRFLKGIRVVDLSRYLPGPLASLMLSDLGAAVIKVESPQGDGLETLGPLRADGRSAWYEAINGGKKILRLDLKQAEDKEVLWRLLDDADVVLESFRPGVMAKMGFSIEQMRQRNPRLIVDSLSGYGQQGPLSQAAGHDINYLATAGFLSDVGSDRLTPAQVSPPAADTFGSMFALSSILAALYAREQSGEGCYLDLALADAVAPILTLALSEIGGPTPRAARASRMGGASAGDVAPAGVKRRGCSVLWGRAAGDYSYALCPGGLLSFAGAGYRLGCRNAPRKGTRNCAAY